MKHRKLNVRNPNDSLIRSHLPSFLLGCRNRGGGLAEGAQLPPYRDEGEGWLDQEDCEFWASLGRLLVCSFVFRSGKKNVM